VNWSSSHLLFFQRLLYERLKYLLAESGEHEIVPFE